MRPYRKNGDRLFVVLLGAVWIVSSVAYYFVFTTFGTDLWLNAQPVIGALAGTVLSYIVIRKILERNRKSRFLVFFGSVSGGVLCFIFPIAALTLFQVIL